MPACNKAYAPYPKGYGAYANRYMPLTNQKQYRFMKETLIIQYKNYIEDDIILEFKDKLKDFEIITEKLPEPEFHYATGDVVSDILIFINENQTALIVSNILGRATYDLLKYSIKELFTGFKKLLKRKNNKETNTKSHTLTLNFKILDKSVDFEINATLDNETANKAIDKAFEYLESKRTEQDLQNQDYLSKEYDYNLAKYKYNSESGLWFPINYGDERRKLKNLIDKANNEFKD